MNLKSEYNKIYKQVSEKIKNAVNSNSKLDNTFYKNIGNYIAKENKRIYDGVKRATEGYLSKSVEKAVNLFDTNIRNQITKNTDFSFILDDDFSFFPEPIHAKTALWNSKKLKQVVMLSLSLGESQEDMLKRIRKVMNINYSDMVMRVRTLKNACDNYAMQKVFEIASNYVKIKKKWINRHDNLVRDSHEYGADGVGNQIVGINERFRNGLLYPCEFCPLLLSTCSKIFCLSSRYFFSMHFF